MDQKITRKFEVIALRPQIFSAGKNEKNIEQITVRWKRFDGCEFWVEDLFSVDDVLARQEVREKLRKKISKNAPVVQEVKEAIRQMDLVEPLPHKKKRHYHSLCIIEHGSKRPVTIGLPSR